MAGLTSNYASALELRQIGNSSISPKSAVLVKYRYYPHVPDDLRRMVRQPQQAALPSMLGRFNQLGFRAPAVQQTWASTAAFDAFSAQTRIFAQVAATTADMGPVQEFTAQWTFQLTAVNQLLEPLRRAAAQVAEIRLATTWWCDSIARQFAAVTIFADATSRASTWFEQISGTLSDVWLAIYPDNWRDPRSPSISAIIELARAGYPVAWVPGGEVLAALAAADPSQRRTVLLVHRQQILDGCADSLGDISGDSLAELREKIAEALASAANGHDSAAQALATNIIDTTLRLYFPPISAADRFKYVKVIKKIDGVDPSACIMRDLPRACVMWPVVPALEPFFGGAKTTFNRHNTAHAVTAIQYSETNTLIGLMLATSLLRQKQHELDQKSAAFSAAI